MKQVLKFVEEYRPGDGKFDPYKAVKIDDKYPSLRWVEIQFISPERKGYTYMSVVLYQKNEWAEEIKIDGEDGIDLRKEDVVLFKDDFYAFSDHDKRLSGMESHLVCALSSGNFLGKEACSAVHSLLWKVMDLQKEIWEKYLPGVFAYRESLKNNE